MLHPLDLTIAIPVKNEERTLQKCLDSIGKNFAKQIVVLDSESTDKTQDVAFTNEVRVINFHWNGQFPKKRNWYLRNFTPTTTWVLFLDADECLTEEFKGALRKELPDSDKNGYWLNYCIYFLGKKLKGGYPLNKLALFRVGAGEYERIDESNWTKLDMEVHEHPIIQGKLGTISQKIDHQDFRGIASYVNKHNEYSTWEAMRYLKTISDGRAEQFTLKQKIKYYLIGSPWFSLLYFFGSFFFMGGFKDGVRGLTFAILKMSYFAQVYCKIIEIKSDKSM